MPAPPVARRAWAWWGLGHAVTLVAFGVPILLFDRFLPERLQQGAETAVAAVIVVLALRLLARWRHGRYDVHSHEDGDEHRHPVRTPHAAFGIGLVHGMGGSAGVGVMLLAAIPSTSVALGSLVLLAAFTGVSMTILTSGFGATLASGLCPATWWEQSRQSVLRASPSASGTRQPPGASRRTRSSRS